MDTLNNLLARRANVRERINDMARGMQGARGSQRQQLQRRLASCRAEFERLNRQITALREGKS